MNQPSPQGPMAYRQPAPTPSLQRDAVEWDFNDAGLLVLEVLALGVIVVAFLGDAGALALVGYLMMLGARGLRTWVVFDPATRTGWRARGFRWLATSGRFGYDSLRPILTCDNVTTRVMRAGREVNRITRSTWSVTLGNSGEGSFKTSKREVAEACCVWAQLATGGQVTPQQLQSAISDHDGRATLRALVPAGSALAALAVLMAYGLDPVYFARFRSGGVVMMAASVAPMLLTAVVRALRIGAWPRCAPVPRAVGKGRAAAITLAAVTLLAYGVVAQKLDAKQTNADESRARVARVLAATTPDPNVTPTSVAGLERAPLVRTLPTRVEGALTEPEAVRRLSAIGFTAGVLPPQGVPGLRRWSMNIDNGTHHGGYAELIALRGADLTIHRSDRRILAVSGGDPAARDALVALLLRRFGGYNNLRSDMDMRDTLTDARYTVSHVSNVGVSTVRARGVRAPMQFEFIDLQLSYSHSLVVESAGDLLIVSSLHGNPQEHLPWTRFVLATLAGLPRS